MKTLILLSAAFAAIIPAAAIAAPANVVVVDNERVFAECTACKAATAQLQAQATALQARQTALAAPLRTEGQALQTAANALNGKEPDAALKARAAAFETKQNAANQELGRMQQNIQSTQANVLRQIQAKLNPIYSQVMAAKGANLALDANSTLARAQTLDVTNDVLAALNAALPSVSVTPGPAPTTPQGR